VEQTLAPTYQREYIVWLTIAKRPETRARRLKESNGALQCSMASVTSLTRASPFSKAVRLATVVLEMFCRAVSVK